MLFKIPISPLPRIMEIYELERKTVWRCADRRNIVVFVTEGSCLFEIGGERLALQKGQALLIPSGQEYVRRPLEDKPCKFFYVHFVTEAPLSLIPRKDAEKEMRETVTRDGNSLPARRQTELPKHLYLSQQTAISDEFDAQHARLNKILSDHFHGTHTAPLFTSLTFCEFLAVLAQTVSPAPHQFDNENEQRLPSSLRQALAYIRYNYDKKISTADLCAHCNLTPQHLIRLFKKHLGKTPLQYINKCKTLHAIELLRTSELSVKEIAYTLGFDNPNYFSRLFTKEESISPAEVRERIRKFDGGESALKGD